jgi:hypothetical protein
VCGAQYGKLLSRSYMSLSWLSLYCAGHRRAGVDAG